MSRIQHLNFTLNDPKQGNTPGIEKFYANGSLKTYISSKKRTNIKISNYTRRFVQGNTPEIKKFYALVLET